MDSRDGSAPETSYASSSPSRSRTRSGPATLTTSDSSTPSSCTLVPDSLLTEREVVTPVRSDPDEAESAPACASYTTIPPPQP